MSRSAGAVPEARSRSRSAIVVGAGFAGLAAATRLRALGFEVTVIEREPAPGGRARALPLAGLEVDPCAALLWTSDVALRSLLDGLGQPDELEAWPAGGLCRADESGVLHPLASSRPSASSRPQGLGRREALRMARLDRLAARYAPLLERRAPERGGVLDDRSAAEWARLYFGDGVRTTWVEPLLAASTLGDDAEASRLLFLLQYKATRRAAAASLRAGPGPLAEALARRLPTRLGVEVEDLVAVSGGFEVACCEAARGEGRFRLSADAVVLAVPPGLALGIGANVLATPEKDYLAGVRHRPALSLALMTRDGVAPPARRIVATAPGRALRSLQFQGGTAQPRASEILVAIASGEFARENGDTADDALVRRLTAEAERLAPQHLREVKAARLVRWTEALPCFGVGHYRAVAQVRKAEAWQLAEGRRLVLAGDHLLGPRLEDAIASGLRAADALAASF
jgi:oxygen-dependent protoporphyrinogen oxidase